MGDDPPKIEIRFRVVIPMAIATYIIWFIIAQILLAFSKVYAVDPGVLICTIILCLPFVLTLNCIFLIVAGIVLSVAGSLRAYEERIPLIQQQSQQMIMK